MEISKRYNSVPVKDSCTLFAPSPLFSGYPTVSFKFLLCRLLLSWNKTDYNSAPAKDNCRLFSPTPYFRTRAMQWCHVNFSSEDPCCHGNKPFLFKDKIGCRLTRVSNAETQLLSYIAWQWNRYFVPQNVFLVIQNILMENEHQGITDEDTYPNLSLHLFKAKRLWVSVDNRLVADVACL